MKKVVIMCVGAAAMKYQKEISKQQELVLHLADIIMATYTTESAVLRAEKLFKRYGEEKGSYHKKLA